MKDDEEGRKREENILYLVRGGGAEPHERAHGVGALAQELVLLVARDLERFREGKGRGKRRVSGKEKKEFFFPRGPLVDERASESRPAILSAAPECALFCDRFSRPELAVSGPLLLSSFRQTSPIDIF